MAACGPHFLEAVNGVLNVVTLLGLAFIAARWPSARSQARDHLEQ